MAWDSRMFTKWRVIIYITIIIICLYIGTFMTKKCVECVERVETSCSTDECISASISYKWSMDTSVDPCDDFYEFACGQWNVDRNNQSVFHRVNNRIAFMAQQLLKTPDKDSDFPPLKQAKIFYRSCMDPINQREPSAYLYTKHLKNIGLPKIPQHFNTSNTKPIAINLTELESKMLKAFSKSYFFEFDFLDKPLVSEPLIQIQIRKDAKIFHRNSRLNSMYTFNNGRYIRKTLDDTESRGDGFEGSGIIDSEGSGINDDEDDDYPHFNFNDLSYAPELDEILNKLGYSGSTYRIHDASRRINAIDTKIYSLISRQMGTFSTITSVDILKVYLSIHRITPSGNLINLMKVLENFIKNTYDSPMKIRINLREVNEFLFILESLEPVDLQLYMWNVATTQIGSTYKIIQEIDFDQSSIKSCTPLVLDLMGAAVSYGLSDLFHNDAQYKKVMKLTDNIHNSYDNSIQRITWMNQLRKNKVLQRSKNLTVVIGHSEKREEMDTLEQHYKDIQLSEYNLIENIFDILVFIYRGNGVQLLAESLQNPLVVNAHYNIHENSINIPKAILIQPLYNLGLEALNYGALGSIIGHEIVHGFDYEEMLKNKTSSEELELRERIHCFAKQFQKFHRKSAFSYLKGYLTASENVADTSGINLSYTSYKKLKEAELALPGFENYTHDQLFFIAYANVWCGNIGTSIFDDHSGNRYRVISTLQNTKQFADSFKCSLGSKMNPGEERCDIFD